MDTTENVLLNVSGKLYQIHKNVQCKLPKSQKSQLISFNGTYKEEHVYYKNRELFERVINYFGGSSLHIPNSMCPVEFEEELEFWKIEPKELSLCCYIKYKQRENARAMINKFFTHRRKKFDKDQNRIQLNKPYLHQLRNAVWDIIEFNTKSTLSKVYFIVSTFFILSAVFGIALSTLPVFREKSRNIFGKNKLLHQSAYLTTQTNNSVLWVLDEITTQTHTKLLPSFPLSDNKEQLQILDDSTTQRNKGGLPISEDSTTKTHKKRRPIFDDLSNDAYKEGLLVSDDSVAQTKKGLPPISVDSTTQLHKEKIQISDDLNTKTYKGELLISDESTTKTHTERLPISDNSITQTHKRGLLIPDDSTIERHKGGLPVSDESTTQTHKKIIPISSESTIQTHNEGLPVSDTSTTQTHKERLRISDDFTTQPHKRGFLKPDGSTTQMQTERFPMPDDSTTQTYITNDFIPNRTLEFTRDIVHQSFLPGQISSKFQSFYSKTEENVISALYYMTNSFFILDVLCRIVCSPNLKTIIKDILIMFDIFITLCAIVWYTLQVYDYHLDYLLYVQIFRVLGLFRILQHIHAFKVLGYTLNFSKRDLLALMMYVCVVIITMSNFLYFVENTNDFTSIPETWWYTLVTMTTLGYGDMVPSTVVGKIIGALSVIIGFLLFSLIIPIMATRFMTLYDMTDIDDLTLVKRRQKKNVFNSKAYKSLITVKCGNYQEI
ncbi:Hypothetical predicted protein [Mytilus galloprovincialis]|uniref:Uncharacterized protein n=1 Tax=Mytilus galloprovincialis TaxID=29158 RepID=A0A8B6BP56_MYTGA|nr:Hypothetical predicted protein [Mytilus galloprovincialis]